MTNSSKQAQGAIISELFAGKWTLSIIEALGSETKRHSELNRSLPGVAQKVLTVTLRRLERYGIVHRKVYPTVPPQVEYKLTQIGLELLNLSSVVSDWAATHEEDIRRAQRLYNRRNKQ